MSLEMPDVETEDEKKQRKKAAQAAAHKKWRQTPKYAEYKQRQKEKKALSK
jgi:hypothetical protein